jgi:imidazolonepropionase-like amidohydrolase
MKSNKTLILLFVLQFSLSQSYSLMNINVIDVETGKIKTQNIHINNDRIVSISSKTIANFKTYDMTGKYAIPGLWEMHSHLGHSKLSSVDLYLVNGVVGIRDMGGHYELEQTIRKMIELENRDSPKILYSSPILEGYNWLKFVSNNFKEPIGKRRIGIKDKDHAIHIIDSLANIEFDHIKVRYSQNIETYNAILEKAKLESIPIYSHHQFYSFDDLKSSLNIGIKSLEHALMFQLDGKTSEERQLVYKLMKNTVMSPTLLTSELNRMKTYSELKNRLAKGDNRDKYLEPSLLDGWKRTHQQRFLEGVMNWKKTLNRHRSYLREMHEYGLTFVTGTDVAMNYIYPGWSVHEEMKLFVEIIEMTPLEALQAATINAAKLVNLVHDYGSLSENKMASLLVLDENPLQDISNTQKIHWVINNGNIYDTSHRENMLSSLELTMKTKTKFFEPEPDNFRNDLIQNIHKTLNEIYQQDINIEAFQATTLPKTLSESEINQLGYQVLQAAFLDQAIAIFKENTERFPKSYNAFDSLAETYFRVDELELAKKYFDISEALNPKETQAQKNRSAWVKDLF